jgi:putative acetyltransferase
MSVRIAIERPDQPEVIALIDALDAYQKPLYPPESHHGIDMNALLQPGVIFAVARKPDGEAVACGAVVVGSGYGELKRMYVRPGARGGGIGRRLLCFLEGQALAQGCSLITLETGIRQPEALRLYEHAGYEYCAPFGDYREDPFSVFMRKPVR